MNTSSSISKAIVFGVALVALSAAAFDAAHAQQDTSRMRAQQGGQGEARPAPAASVPQPAGEGDARVIDRCCFDLDGQGPADDGIFVVAQGGEVLVAIIYDDPDQNKRFDAADEIRAITLGVQGATGR